MTYHRKLQALAPELLHRIEQAQQEIDWLRSASGDDLLRLATDQNGLKPLEGIASHLTAVELGNLERSSLLEFLASYFAPGTSTAADLADQIQLCRAFANPLQVTERVAAQVEAAIAGFPRTSSQLRVGSNPGDVLDPFILAANYELLSDRDLPKTIEHTTSHKVLMKIEDLVGNLHQNVISAMRGNFRIPEPRGEELDPALNPFPGADVGQAPLPERPEALRLFQVKSKTGSAKGGDGKRLGEQLLRLATTYDADTFYVAIVGNTLRGHRSKAAVIRESPNTAVMVGEAALNEITQSAVGAELLLRTYQRAFRAASEETGYSFTEIVALISADFEEGAEQEGTDFLSAWLHEAVGGPVEEQDSRREAPIRRRRRRGTISNSQAIDPQPALLPDLIWKPESPE
jgi:hypothetical protein